MRRSLGELIFLSTPVAQLHRAASGFIRRPLQSRLLQIEDVLDHGDADLAMGSLRSELVVDAQ